MSKVLQKEICYYKPEMSYEQAIGIAKRNLLNEYKLTDLLEAEGCTIREEKENRDDLTSNEFSYAIYRIIIEPVMFETYPVRRVSYDKNVLANFKPENKFWTRVKLAFKYIFRKKI